MSGNLDAKELIYKGNFALYMVFNIAKTPNFTSSGVKLGVHFAISADIQRLLRRDRVMNLLSYILEIQLIIKMSMP